MCVYVYVKEGDGEQRALRWVVGVEREGEGICVGIWRSNFRKVLDRIWTKKKKDRARNGCANWHSLICLPFNFFFNWSSNMCQALWQTVRIEDEQNKLWSNSGVPRARVYVSCIGNGYGRSRNWISRSIGMYVGSKWVYGKLKQSQRKLGWDEDGNREWADMWQMEGRTRREFFKRSCVQIVHWVPKVWG